VKKCDCNFSVEIKVVAEFQNKIQWAFFLNSVKFVNLKFVKSGFSTYAGRLRGGRLLLLGAPGGTAAVRGLGSLQALDDRILAGPDLLVHGHAQFPQLF